MIDIIFSILVAFGVGALVAGIVIAAMQARRFTRGAFSHPLRQAHPTRAPAAARPAPPRPPAPVQQPASRAERAAAAARSRPSETTTLGIPRVRFPRLRARRRSWAWLSLAVLTLVLGAGIAFLGTQLYARLTADGARSPAGAAGNGSVTVPSLRGLSEDEATTALNEAGLTVGAARTVSSDEPAGTVVGSDPPQDSAVEPETPITLLLSGGPSDTTASAGPTVSATPVGPVAPSGQVHVVRPGENLTDIARTYDATVEAFVELNELRDPNFIFVGQRLQVPAPTAP